MPEKIVTILNYNGNEYEIYQDQVEKYCYITLLSSNTTLQKVKSNTFTLSKLDSFIKYHETDDGRFLYDSFLNARNNTTMYPEHSCIYLIQILEGVAIKFKPMTDKERENRQDKDENNDNENLDHALAYYIGNGNNYMKEVFRLSEDKNANKHKVNQLKEELRKLRNDYCHYTSSHHYRYSGLQYRDLKFRLVILVRLIFLENFDIAVDDKLFKGIMKTIKKIEIARKCNLII